MAKAGAYRRNPLTGAATRTSADLSAAQLGGVPARFAALKRTVPARRGAFGRLLLYRRLLAMGFDRSSAQAMRDWR